MFRCAGYSITRSLFVVAVLAASLCFSGCAVSSALFSDMESLNLGDQAIALVVLEAENRIKPESAPQLITIRVIGEDNAIFTFSAPQPADVDSGTVQRYLLSFRLPEGSYRLHSARGRSRVNADVDEWFVIPIQHTFSLNSGEIAYLGRIKAVNRERKLGEERAGELIVSEAMDSAGYAEGTFDVEIRDSKEVDIPLYKREYAALREYTIKPRLLAAVSSTPKSEPETGSSVVASSAVEDADTLAIEPAPSADTPELTLPSTPKVVRGALKGRSEKPQSMAVEENTGSTRRCSVDQILGMNRLGLSEIQINEACE